MNLESCIEKKWRRAGKNVADFNEVRWKFRDALKKSPGVWSGKGFYVHLDVDKDDKLAGMIDYGAFFTTSVASSRFHAYG